MRDDDPGMIVNDLFQVTPKQVYDWIPGFMQEHGPPGGSYNVWWQDPRDEEALERDGIEIWCEFKSSNESNRKRRTLFYIHARAHTDQISRVRLYAPEVFHLLTDENGKQKTETDSRLQIVGLPLARMFLVELEGPDRASERINNYWRRLHQRLGLPPPQPFLFGLPELLWLSPDHAQVAIKAAGAASSPQSSTTDHLRVPDRSLPPAAGESLRTETQTGMPKAQGKGELRVTRKPKDRKRDNKIRDLWRVGTSDREIALAVHLSPARVKQIRHKNGWIDEARRRNKST